MEWNGARSRMERSAERGAGVSGARSAEPVLAERTGVSRA